MPVVKIASLRIVPETESLTSIAIGKLPAEPVFSLVAAAASK